METNVITTKKTNSYSKSAIEQALRMLLHIEEEKFLEQG